MNWIKKEWHIPEFFDSDMPATKENWENRRRKEILKLFSEEVYGVTPRRRPDRAETEVILDNPNDRGGKNHHKRILYHMWFDDRRVSLEIDQWTPHGKGPFPVQMMIDPFEHALFENYTFYDYYQFFPSDFITDRGYAAVKVNTSTICHDSKERFYEGILGVLDDDDEGIKEENRWGAIGAWAWAGSRCIDYLETQSEMDVERIAVSGMSRAGKAALWCGAQEQRIAVVMSNVSGMGGSAITRGKNGEHIKDITTAFPFWFSKKFSTYADDEDSLPVDAHMLLAMAAPRPIYMASASFDIWADIFAEYKGLYMSAEIYKLYYDGIDLPSEKPENDMPFHIGPIGYHTRTGPHGLTYYDWQKYLDFCDCYLKIE